MVCEKARVKHDLLRAGRRTGKHIHAGTGGRERGHKRGCIHMRAATMTMNESVRVMKMGPTATTAWCSQSWILLLSLLTLSTFLLKTDRSWLCPAWGSGMLVGDLWARKSGDGG